MFHLGNCSAIAEDFRTGLPLPQLFFNGASDGYSLRVSELLVELVLGILAGQDRFQFQNNRGIAFHPNCSQPRTRRWSRKLGAGAGNSALEQETRRWSRKLGSDWRFGRIFRYPGGPYPVVPPGPPREGLGLRTLNV